MQSSTLISALVLFATASAMGINCRGNSNCAGTACSLTTLNSQVQQLPDTNIYSPGQHITCCGDGGVPSALCVFSQNTQNWVSGEQVKFFLAQLLEHGCGKCGSVPFQDSDVIKGQLTVNWVNDK